MIVALDGDRVVGLAPWCVERVAPLGNVVRFLGSDDACTDYQSILVENGYESAIASALSDWLVRRGGRGTAVEDDQCNWDLMELSGVDCHSDVTRALVENLETKGFTTHERTIKNCWRIPFPATFDEYLAALSKPNRRRVRWPEKRMAMPDCAVPTVCSPEEFDVAWQAFVELHQRRRESLGDNGCFSREAFTAFLRDAAKAFLDAGLLEFATVSLNSNIVAAELCIQGETTTFAYQIGIDPDALKESPGWLVNTVSIRRALSSAQTGFDLCRGDEEYKRHLGARSEPCLEYRVVPPRFRPQLWHKAWVTGTTMKELIKNGLTITGIRQ